MSFYPGIAEKTCLRPEYKSQQKPLVSERMEDIGFQVPNQNLVFMKKECDRARIGAFHAPDLGSSPRRVMQRLSILFSLFSLAGRPV